MKRAVLLRTSLFFALLFSSAVPSYSMGLFRAIKKRVRGKPHAQLIGEAEIKGAFEQTNFTPKIFALVLGYCSSEFKLGVITLPDAKKKKNATFKYPKHSAVRVYLEGDILTVLTTADQLLNYRLPNGVLVSKESANWAPEIYLFENGDYEYVKVDGQVIKSKEGSVFVADSRVHLNASNESYLAEIVGDLSELKVDFSSPSRLLSNYEEEGINSDISEIWVTKRYGVRGTCAIYSPQEEHAVHGHCYYDNSKLPLGGPQPCTTIEISLPLSALARMLNVELPELEPVVQKEVEQKEEELAGF